VRTPAIGNERSLEAAVTKYLGQPATFRPSLFYGGDPTDIVRYAGSDNDYRHEQAKGVNNPERFPARYLLAGIISPASLAVSRRHAKVMMESCKGLQ